MNLRFFNAIILVSSLISCGKHGSENSSSATTQAAGEESIELAVPETPETPEVAVAGEEEDSMPSDSGKIAVAFGDLDGDTFNEKVTVLNTSRQTDLGTERTIEIYKKEKGDWKLWHKSTGAVLPSEHGGPMGDPFSEIFIERKCIVITHAGGGRTKWNYTHRYRFQNNDWYLIGTTVNFGTPCEYWKNYDYNLMTGKVEARHTVENCEEDSLNKETKFSFTQKISLPKMDNFYPGDHEVKVPGKVDSFYY